MNIIISFLLTSIFLYSQNISGSNIQALYKLNDLRNKSGLNSFKQSNILEKSAKNHTNYLISNKTIGHNQIPFKKNFTGITPSQRIINSGYNHFNVGENLTGNIFSYNTSIDLLMTAIYHRLTFLNFNFDEIGLFGNKNIITYNLGNSKIYNICKSKTYFPKYNIHNLCTKKQNFSQSDFNQIKFIEKNNPKIVVFPSNQSINNMTTFYDETPDPLPDRIVSGNPISIQFNPSKFKNIELLSFKLFQGYNEIKNTRIISKFNDPNNIINKYTYVLFPLNRLKWGKTYNVKVKYKSNNQIFNKEWSFHTKSLNGKYIDIYNDKFISLWNNTNYYLFFPPEVIGKIKKYSTNCSNINFIDYNTIYINSNHNCFIKVNNKSFNLKFK